jgi:hypothetical protein
MRVLRRTAILSRRPAFVRQAPRPRSSGAPRPIIPSDSRMTRSRSASGKGSPPAAAAAAALAAAEALLARFEHALPSLVVFDLVRACDRGNSECTICSRPPARPAGCIIELTSAGQTPVPHPHATLPPLQDYTLWPYWCEMMSARDSPWLYPQDLSILKALELRGVQLALASRTPTPDVAAAFF